MTSGMGQVVPKFAQILKTADISVVEDTAAATEQTKSSSPGRRQRPPDTLLVVHVVTVFLRATASRMRFAERGK